MSLLALLSVVALVSGGAGQAQTQPTQPVSDTDPVQLEDVVVTGRRLDDLVRDFVGEVAAPNSGRGLARWDGPVCVGVANLRNDAAQYITDRVSTVAEDLGLRPGAPGCTPNILIIATADGREVASRLVSDRARSFRAGGSGMDQGSAALRQFTQSERPVRWWQQSMPVDSETGRRAVRLPGDCEGPCNTAPNGSVLGYAPIINVDSASRLRTQIVDRMFRTIVIVDVDAIQQVSLSQLADYVAFASMAQIDPEADTSAYASILNVFDHPEVADSLTTWDKAYLSGLYQAESTRLNRRANRNEISESIVDAHSELRRREDADSRPQTP